MIVITQLDTPESHPYEPSRRRHPTGGGDGNDDEDGGRRTAAFASAPPAERPTRADPSGGGR